MPSFELDIIRHGPVDRAHAFTALHDDEQRRFAVTAARDKDLAGLWTVVEAYLIQRGRSASQASPHTLRNYRLGVRVFLEHARTQAWNLLKPDRHAPQRWVNLLATSHDDGQILKPATVRLYVQGARALYRALNWAGATEADPFKEVRLPKDPADALTNRPPYRDAQLRQLLDRATPPGHLEVLLLLCAHAGLRIDEAVNVQWSDVRLGERRLIVRSGKGGKTRRVPLSDRLYQSLSRHQRETQTLKPAALQGTLFPYRTRPGALYHLRKFVNGTSELTGLTWQDFRGFHALRKLAGTKLYRRRKDLGAVAAFLGHADISTTRRYAEITPDDYEADLADW
ncbi:tyrosine-type recombinase/integrase [Deinococcus peraridilitoris]|uniref:Site-specific recombinase XerD n=1 Tax=Deinococcus peraridilitoris (strain DSM 19664 / LMG 22246 / CIP 109416 / KR-200) TaxID=937777 RepID=L0A6M4_DEIPD|nr:tyrosine-type recombinase/integrase [Deinococcus peraridilitoris]AFZ69496.1 site-specific recombinase XerD [Deinococcus peraridilitoris DSM 19664]